MKTFLKLAGLWLLIMASLFVFEAPHSDAQYMGTFSQQTVAESFTANYPSGGTATQFFDIQNLGQAAHQVNYKWNASFSGATIELEGSSDGVHWFILALGVNEISSAKAFVADGYFPFERLAVNPEQNTMLAGSTVSIEYSGYQNPLPVPNLATPVIPMHVTTYQALQGEFGEGAGSSPLIMVSVTCENPGAATAYIDLTF